MSLKSRSFLVYKGDTLDNISQYLDQEIGLNAYLIKDIQAVSLNETVTQVTVLYNKYPDQALDSIAPREGAIFGSGIANDDFDIRFLFNYPIDFGSIESGTFLIDGQGLSTDKINLDNKSNKYFLKVSASGAGFQNYAFHTYQVAPSLKRIDGSSFSYTPVGGYIFNDLSSAHIGDYSRPYADRRRGKVAVGVVRLSKSINPQQGIVEYLNQKQITEDRLISYTSVSTSTNTCDVYFVYLVKIEPQIVSGFPLNNALLPQVSAPDKVTLVFSVQLDKAKLLSTAGLFTIESGFSSSINVSPSDITLLSDLKTVEINTSSYFTAEKVYSIIARPGILGLDGLEKEKPEQWTIHISAYEAAGDLVFTGEISGAPTGAAYVLYSADPILDNAVVLRFANRITGYPPGSPGGTPGYLMISGVAIEESFTYFSGEITGHTGQKNPHNTTYLEVGAVALTEYTGHTGQKNPHGTTFAEVGAVSLVVYTGHTGQKNPHGTTYVEVGAPSYAEFSGHTGVTGIHFTQADISIPASQIYNFTAAVNDVVGELGGVTEAQFSGHTGRTDNPHGVTAEQINAVTVGQYSYLSGLLTGHTGDYNNPHGVTASQVGAPTLANYAYLSGIVTGHTGNYNNPHGTTPGQIGAATTQAYDYLSGNTLAVDLYLLGEITARATIAQYDYLSGQHSGHTGRTDNPHGTTASQIGAATTTQYNYLSGQHSGHTGRLDNPHGTTAAQVGAPTLSNYSYLSGQFTGHTGLKNPHGLTLGDLGGQPLNTYLTQISSKEYAIGDMLYINDQSEFAALSISTNTNYILGVQDIGGGTYLPYWKAPGGSLAGSVINDLDDVDATPSLGSLLGWNTSSGAWQAVKLTGLGAISVTTNNTTNTTTIEITGYTVPNPEIVPSHVAGILRCPLHVATAQQISSDTANWCYLGYLPSGVLIKKVRAFCSTAAGGTVTGEVCIATSTGAPNGSPQTVTKLWATTGVDSLLTTGPKGNTVDNTTALTGAAHTWAGLRVTTHGGGAFQPSFQIIARDWGIGFISQTPSAGLLTTGTSWTATPVTAANNSSIDIRGYLF